MNIKKAALRWISGAVVITMGFGLSACSHDDAPQSQDTPPAANATATQAQTGQEAPPAVASEEYNKGLKYARGDGIAQDEAEAARWFRLAAEQGNIDGAYQLGLIYARGGSDVAQDFSKAHDWLYKAAMGGHPNAQYFLGMMYINGDGVQVDEVQATVWFWLATTLGDEYARARLRTISTRMPAVQYAEAQRQANTLWKKIPHDRMIKGKRGMH